MGPPVGAPRAAHCAHAVQRSAEPRGRHSARGHRRRTSGSPFGGCDGAFRLRRWGRGGTENRTGLSWGGGKEERESRGGGRGLRVAPPYGAAPPPGVGRPSGGLRPVPARPGAAPSPLICSWNRDLKRCGGGPGGGGRGERRCGAAGVGRRAEGGAAPRLRPGTPSIEVGERCGGGTGRGGCGWGGAGGTWGRWGSGAGGGMGRGTRVGAGMAALCAPEPPPPRPQRGAAIRVDGAEGAQCGGVS